jgi:hypothetical protein
VVLPAVLASLLGELNFFWCGVIDCVVAMLCLEELEWCSELSSLGK